MKSTFIAVIVTAAITIPVTYFVAKSKGNSNRLDEKTEQINKTAQMNVHASGKINMTANQYRLDQAQNDIDTFKLHCTQLMPFISLDSIIKGYTIDAGDLLTAMGIPQSKWPHCVFNRVRVYLGLTPVAVNSRYNFRLFVVPVCDTCTPCNDCDGKDLVFDTNGNICPFPDSGAAQNYTVQDLIAPCPHTCDYSSPLSTKYDPSKKK